MLEDSFMNDTCGDNCSMVQQQEFEVVKFTLATDQELAEMLGEQPASVKEEQVQQQQQQQQFAWLLSEQPLLMDEDFEVFQFQQQQQQLLQQLREVKTDLKSKTLLLTRRLRKRASRVVKSKTGASSSSSGGGGGLLEQSQVCRVCGDPATGFHYSALTCEACKSFFKRTVQDKHNYTCCGNLNCTVSRSLRKACQYCRFQKCLQSGMQPMEVRMDHTRGGRRKCKRTSREQFDRLIGNIACQPTSTTMSTAADAATAEIKSGVPIDSRLLLRDFILDVESAHIAYCQLPIELPLPNWLAVEVRTPSAFRLAVRHWFRQGMQSVIRWARSLACLAALSRQDLSELLHENWLAVLALDTLAWSQPFDGTIRFGSNFCLRREDLGDYQPLSDFYCTLQSMFCSLDSLQLHMNELAVLKLVALLDQSVADRLIDTEAIGPLAGAAMRALYAVGAEKFQLSADSPQVDDYIGRMLMRLGFTVNLRHGCRVWTSLDPPSCSEAREIIDAAMDEPLNHLPIASSTTLTAQHNQQRMLRRQEGSSGSFCLSPSSSSASLML